MAKEEKKVTQEEPLVNCLRNERIIVRHIPRQKNKISNSKHPLYGGMAESAEKTFVVPRLSSGKYVNVLTDAEKAYLEEIMGLEFNALSIYKKENNYWSDANPISAATVTLTKQDNFLDLSDPEDYIRYKVLLANKDSIASSMEEYENHPKATYQYVIISEGDETKNAKKGMNLTMQCYTMYGKIEDDVATLRLILELINGTTISSNTKKDFLQTKINEAIQGNPKMFLQIVSDPLLRTKVLIRECVEEGHIIKRGDQYYVKEGNLPMCNNGDPTFNVAAQWLNMPKHQDTLLSLEAKLKE